MSCQYDVDYVGWTCEQAKLLLAGDYSALDIQHLHDEILSLGEIEASRFCNYAQIYFLHRLKKRYQKKKTKSWEYSIDNSLIHMRSILRRNPSLKPRVMQILTEAYIEAKLAAEYETDLDEETFPSHCPFSVKEIFPTLEEEYL